MNKLIKAGLNLGLMLSCFSSFGQKEVNLGSLLKQLTDIESAAKWPDPYYNNLQASSYDRRSVSPDQPWWFANADASKFIRTETVNGHKEYVMMDADGPGAVVRFWLTTFKREGKLRIYFDNKPEPEILIPAYDLMQSGLQLGKALLTPHSSYEAKEKGGSNLYLPMPFSKHCKITWEDAEPEVKQPRYYQVNYRKYAPGTKVRTFTLAQLKQQQQLADEVNQKLLNPDNTPKGKTITKNQRIEPGKEIAVTLPAGSSALHLLTVKLQSDQDYAQALRSTIIRISFDGKETVWCPLGDFAGSGVGAKPLQSWYRTITGDGQISSRFIMPYQKSAVITIVNMGKQPVGIDLSASVKKWNWDKNSMYFHTNWKSESKVVIKGSETDKGLLEWTFNKIKGRGKYIGDALSVFNNMHTWYGEGDQKIWTDNDTFPSEYGTGAEDYYNTSWAPVVLYQTPFANAPRADNTDSYGYNTFTRTRNLDAVPFKDSFRLDLEMLGWKDGDADCSVTTYWYGFKDTESNVAPLEAEAVKPLSK